MGDGVFVTSREWDNTNVNEDLNRYDSIDGINIYSFTTFDSLNEYTKVNNLIRYSDQSNSSSKQEQKSDLAKNNYLKKARDSLNSINLANDKTDKSNNTILTRKQNAQFREIRMKAEKIDEFPISFDRHFPMQQATINETITYDYGDTSTNKAGNNSTKKSKCGMQHCSYGCICDTISNTTSIIRDHCGRYECMFECTCNNTTKRKPNQRQLTKESENDDSNSNDGNSNYAARRSKRQKYMSLKAYEYYESDKSCTAKAQLKNNNPFEEVKKDSLFGIRKCKRSEANNRLKIQAETKKPSLITSSGITANQQVKSSIKSCEKKDKINNYATRLREKLNKQKFKAKETILKKSLKNANKCKDVNRLRSQFHNRIKNSLKHSLKCYEKQFKPYVQSVVLKINSNSSSPNKAKYNQTIPLYVEVFAEWSLKSNSIFRRICQIIKKFSINKITNWEQLEFDYEDLTVRLSSKSYNNLNSAKDSNPMKLNPILVKVLKLNKAEKINYVEKMKSRHCFNVVNPIIEKKFGNFLNYSTSTSTDLSKDNNIDNAPSLENNLNNTNEGENKINVKSLPRLLMRKRSMAKALLSKEANDAKLNVDNYENISPIVYQFRSDEYSKKYYNPFRDENLVKPLYKSYGRYYVDEVSDMLNRMVHGICIHDEQLKIEERKKREIEEKNRKFLNFTQKILHDTKTISPNMTSGYSYASSSAESSSYAHSGPSNILAKAVLKHVPKASSESSSTFVFHNNNNNTQQTYSTMANKRVTPILPKLPPCIKIISNNNNNNSTQLDTQNKYRPVCSNQNSNNIITKLFSKSSSLPLTQSSHNIVNTKLFTTSTNGNQKIITTTTGTNQNNVSPISVNNKIENNNQQPLQKTFIKLVSVNNQIGNNSIITKINKDVASAGDSKQMVQISSKIISSPVNIKVEDSVKLNNTSPTNANENQADKVLIESASQKQPNNIMQHHRPASSSNTTTKTIYKIFPKSNTDIGNDATKRSSFVLNNSISSNATRPESIVQQSIEEKTKEQKEEVPTAILTTIKVEPTEIVEHVVPSTIDDQVKDSENTLPKLSDSTIAMRKRKRKQDFSELLSKCVSNSSFLNQLSNEKQQSNIKKLL